MATIIETLRLNLVNTLGKVCSFYTGNEQESVAIILRNFDVNNLKTILRSLSKGIPPEEIETLLFPVGKLTEGALAELAHATEPRIAIDLVASMGFPIAQPLLKLRAERPGADIIDMELALDRWYAERTQRDIEKLPGATDFLRLFLDIESDLTNLLTVLRFVQPQKNAKSSANRWAQTIFATCSLDQDACHSSCCAKPWIRLLWNPWSSHSS
jgi:vacuolar-type H+-ATPase subunit C/Vma6